MKKLVNIQLFLLITIEIEHLISILFFKINIDSIIFFFFCLLFNAYMRHADLIYIITKGKFKLNYISHRLYELHI